MRIFLCASSMTREVKQLRCSWLPILFGFAAFSVFLTQGCGPRGGEYRAAASIAVNGFAVNSGKIKNIDGQAIKLWGYVDHHNIYAHDARRILGDWLGREGPSPTEWRFNLKGRAEDGAGNSIPVYVASDQHRDRLLTLFTTDAMAGKPTKVYIQAVLKTFNAPANFQRLTGIILKVESGTDIIFEDLYRPGSNP